MNPVQRGCRAGHSCFAQLLEHHENILTSLEERHNVNVLNLDFEKAFDKVDRGELPQTQEACSKWWTRKVYPRVSSEKNQWCCLTKSIVTSGVPQASVLGHCHAVTNFVVRSFADDTRIQCEMSTVTSAANLQQDLNSIFTWTEYNIMSFNANKSELLC